MQIGIYQNRNKKLLKETQLICCIDILYINKNCRSVLDIHKKYNIL